MIKRQYPQKNTQIFGTDQRYTSLYHAKISIFIGYESTPTVYPYYTKHNFYRYILILSYIVEETM